MSIMFNEVCINEEMLPKYTYFKLHDPAAHKYNSTLEIDPPLMMAQSRAESTRDTYNYGQYLNQSPLEYDKSNTGIRTDPEENM